MDPDGDVHLPAACRRATARSFRGQGALSGFFPSRGQPALRRYPCAALLIPRRGAFRCRDAQASWSLVVGQALLVAPRCLLAYEPLRGRPDCFLVEWYCHRDCPATWCRWSVGDPAFMAALGRRVFSASYAPHADAARLRSGIDLLLAEAEHDLTATRVDPRVLAACGHLERDHWMPVEAVAQRVGLGRRQLEQLFRRDRGCSPKAWQGRMRMRRAQALLQQGLTVVACAAELGYADAASFSRHFKQVVGCPPSRWRN